MSEDRVIPYGVGAWSSDEERERAFGVPLDTGDQEDRIPIAEDVTRAYLDGRKDGRRESAARIRRELLAGFMLDHTGLRGDPQGAWTSYRHLEERVAAERAANAELVRAADTHRDVGQICDAWTTLAKGDGRFIPPDVELGWNLAVKYLILAVEARGKE